MNLVKFLDLLLGEITRVVLWDLREKEAEREVDRGWLPSALVCHQVKKENCPGTILLPF